MSVTKVFRPFLQKTLFQPYATRALSLSGVYPPLVTPFAAGTEDVDYGQLEKLLQRLNRFPLAGFVCLGSNGEFPLLETREKVEIVESAKKIVGKDRTVIAGAGAESTRETIDLVKRMSSVGADAVLVYNPCYFKSRMNTKAYVTHFTKIADASPIPVVLYNVPAYTGIDIPIDAICELSKHENIIGIKESTGDITRISNICRLTAKVSNSFSVVNGSAGSFLPALSVGCVGVVSALANVLPAELCQLHFLFNEGRMKEAKQLQHTLTGPNGAVTAVFGVPGLKVALKALADIDTGVVRSPLQPLEPAEIERVLSTFREAGFGK